MQPIITILFFKKKQGFFHHHPPPHEFVLLFELEFELEFELLPGLESLFGSLRSPLYFSGFFRFGKSVSKFRCHEFESHNKSVVFFCLRSKSAALWRETREGGGKRKGRKGGKGGKEGKGGKGRMRVNFKGGMVAAAHIKINMIYVDVKE